MPSVPIHSTDSVFSELNDYDSPLLWKSRGEGNSNIHVDNFSLLIHLAQ